MRTLLILSCILNLTLSAVEDIENVMPQDFILGIQKLEIPHYPYAFNPSIVRWKKGFLLSFRIIPDRRNSFTSMLGVVVLDDFFQPISKPQLLNTREIFDFAPSRAEDGRLIAIGKKIYMVYSDNKEIKISKGGFRVYIAEVCYDEKFYLKNKEPLLEFTNETRLIREKNWVPFEYNNELLLAYSIDPHRIIRPLPGTNSCEEFCQTNQPLPWDWGIIRGGTQAYLIQDSYLSFFHSSIEMCSLQSNNKKAVHYYMGAYTFSKDPPFEIEKMSPEPIITKGFYTGISYKPFWKPVKVVFPCGFIYDDNYIWVTYGRDDNESWIVKLDRKKLMESLVPISQ